MAAQEMINDISFCNEERCAGDCGEALDLCEQGLLGAQAVAADVADVIYTTNSGGAWTNTAVQPFAATENVISVACVRKDTNTTRWIVVRDTDGATAAEIAYSDDSGATWTNVDVESSGSFLGAVDSGALFAYDYKHIWLVLSGGYIVFSSDGGATWTTQDAGTATTEDYNAVHFASTEHGFAVASTGVVVKTDDGGETWSIVTAITGTPSVQCVYTFDEDNVIVGDENGDIWRSFDSGVTWTSLYSGTSINDITFVNRYVGWAVDDDAILRTRNGGEDWEEVTDGLPSDVGAFNAVWGCDANYAFAVGDNDTDEGLVVKVYG